MKNGWKSVTLQRIQLQECEIKAFMMDGDDVERDLELLFIINKIAYYVEYRIVGFAISYRE